MFIWFRGKNIFLPKVLLQDKTYQIIPNISPGLINICVHFLGGLYSESILCEVSEYQDFEIHYHILLLQAKKAFLQAKIIFMLINNLSKTVLVSFNHNNYGNIFPFQKDLGAVLEICLLPHFQGRLYSGGLILGGKFV